MKQTRSLGSGEELGNAVGLEDGDADEADVWQKDVVDGMRSRTKASWAVVLEHGEDARACASVLLVEGRRTWRRDLGVDGELQEKRELEGVEASLQGRAETMTSLDDDESGDARGRTRHGDA
jgi:hypothetical protein